MLSSVIALDRRPAFDGAQLDGKTQMRNRSGLIRLHALPAADFRHARTFTEYIGGPRTSVTVRLGTGGLEPGDVAGLALGSRRYAWIAVEAGRQGCTLAQFDEATGRASRLPLTGPEVWLRVECDFVDNHARFSHGAGGQRFASVGWPYALGDPHAVVRSICCSLFAYSTALGAGGGHADFDSFVISWP